MNKIKVGDMIRTPRFLNVSIEEVLNRQEAREKGYTEPTHYRDNPDYDILGKSIGINCMVFGAVKKE